MLGVVSTLMLIHRHSPSECRVAFAAWNGFRSRLRRGPVIGSCRTRGATGDHLILWQVEAPGSKQALALLPSFIAERTEAIPVEEVRIP
jgi:hypothetical protein